MQPIAGGEGRRLRWRTRRAIGVGGRRSRVCVPRRLIVDVARRLLLLSRLARVHVEVPLGIERARLCRRRRRRRLVSYAESSAILGHGRHTGHRN